MTSFVSILCCLCGKTIQPNSAALCSECLQSEVNITDSIQGSGLKVFQCRRCQRWQGKNDHFVQCQAESVELLALCLKRIPGLDKQDIVDASFIWTEPHCMRLKVKVTLKRNVLNGVLLQQEKVIEFVVSNRQCNDCSRIFSNDTWRAVVQVRQRVDQKRTFFRLEQQILASNAQHKTTDIRSQKDGIDFYFSERNHALQFTEWLKGVVPYRLSKSRKLISVDNHSNISKDQMTLRCDIVPVCKNDIVIVPYGSRKLGCQVSGSIALVINVSSSLHLIDPFSLKRADITADKYWKSAFSSLLTSHRLIEFIVLNVEPLGFIDSDPSNDFLLVDAEVARSCDLGMNDDRFVVRTHLGRKIQTGSSVLGYDLRGGNFSESALDNLKGDLPDIVLVKLMKTKKAYHQKRGKNRQNFDAQSNDSDSSTPLEKEDEIGSIQNDVIEESTHIPFDERNNEIQKVEEH